MLRMGFVFLFVSSFGLTALTQITTPAIRPFDPYESLQPGAPVATLNEFSCRFLYTIRRNPHETVYCRLYPRDGVFDAVHIIAKEQMIRRVVFVLEGDVVFGHLVDVWGRPDDVWQDQENTVACWRSGVRAEMRVVGWRLHYHTHVRQVKLMDIGDSPELIQIPADRICGNG